MNQSILEQIKGKILPTLEQAQVTKAALFGSYVRGDNDENSDIDILIAFPPGRSLFNFISLERDLEEILQKKVDLVDYQWIHPLLRDSILRWQYPILPAKPDGDATADGVSQAGASDNSPQPATKGKKMKKDPLIYLTRILESINHIGTFLQGVTWKHFSSSMEKQDAVAKRLELIGESVKSLPDEFRSKHAEVPWKDWAGLRDRIVHQYFDLNLDVIWDTIIDDLPLLKKHVEQFIQEHPHSEEAQTYLHGPHQ
jgi:uncharacterized protein with HEPN domain/predicted nucleotidyltransferase